MKPIRLDKFLADSGLGTRSQVKSLLKKKLVTVNGAPAGKPEQKIDPETDTVVCRGKPLTYTEFFYYMLNKPAGYVSATDDNTAPTVLSLLKGAPGKDLFPVGRLDKDTEGLLLLTNDGPLAHRLLSPRRHVDKTYFVRAEGAVTKADLLRLEEGIDIGEEKPTLPAKARLLRVLSSDGGNPKDSPAPSEPVLPSGDGPRNGTAARSGKMPSAEFSEVLLTIHEGKFHQVKRMFAAIGKPVLYLKRLSIGGVSLDESLKPGQFRALTKEELERLTAGQTN